VGLFIFAVFVLSAAGTYSMMSFTVSQRTREIGIRTALGASARQVLGDVVAGLVFAMGLYACGRPMRRALRIEPTEALRDGT